MDSPFYSQDEFDLNLPAHHSHLKEKFNFLLERSIASTKGSPLNTPEPSVFDFKSTCKAFNLKKNEKRQRKTTKKMNVFDENVKILDIVETKASNSNLKNVHFFFIYIFSLLLLHICVISTLKNISYFLVRFCEKKNPKIEGG